ncbi:hypothetical protein L0P60_15410, partial [Dorea formicigenerans]|nr:hypothetical protein [Dorea formicigenerans]
PDVLRQIKAHGVRGVARWPSRSLFGQIGMVAAEGAVADRRFVWNPMTPELLPLSAKIWLVQMAAFHLIGLGFHWLDTSGRLARYRVRP